MQLHLYRPVMWRRGGSCICLRDARDVSPREAATLIALKWATYLLPTDTTQGESMSNDRSSALRLVTPPASEPITLAQAKSFLRVEHSADDDAITRAISAVRRAAEEYVKTALLPQVWDYTTANPCGAVLRLPFGPAQSITSVTLTNELGTNTVMDAANYRLSVDGFAVHFTNPQSTEKLTVRYSASAAATVADVPVPLVQGMLHHLAVMMETRDGSAKLPVQAQQCYQPYRRVSL